MPLSDYRKAIVETHKSDWFDDFCLSNQVPPGMLDNLDEPLDLYQRLTQELRAISLTKQSSMGTHVHQTEERPTASARCFLNELRTGPANPFRDRWALLAILGRPLPPHLNLSSLPQNANGDNPLAFLVLSGNVEALKLALEQLTSKAKKPEEEKEQILFRANKFGTTCVHYAAMSNHPLMLDYVLTLVQLGRVGVDVAGNQLVHYAALSGSQMLQALSLRTGTSIADLLLQEASYISRSTGETVTRTAAYYCAFAGNTDFADCVLENIDRRFLNKDGSAPHNLFCAVCLSGNLENVKNFLQEMPGYCQAVREKFSVQLITAALQSGNPDLLEYLLTLRKAEFLRSRVGNEAQFLEYLKYHLKNAGEKGTMNVAFSAILSGNPAMLSKVHQMFPALFPPIDSNGETLLHHLTRCCGMPSMLTQCLEILIQESRMSLYQRLDVPASQSNLTLLQTICWSGNTTLMQALLVDHGLLSQMSPKNISDFLCHVAITGNIEMMSCIISVMDPSQYRLLTEKIRPPSEMPVVDRLWSPLELAFCYVQEKTDPSLLEAWLGLCESCLAKQDLSHLVVLICESDSPILLPGLIRFALRTQVSLRLNFFTQEAPEVFRDQLANVLITNYSVTATNLLRPTREGLILRKPRIQGRLEENGVLVRPLLCMRQANGFFTKKTSYRGPFFRVQAQILIERSIHVSPEQLLFFLADHKALTQIYWEAVLGTGSFTGSPEEAQPASWEPVITTSPKDFMRTLCTRLNVDNYDPEIFKNGQTWKDFFQFYNDPKLKASPRQLSKVLPELRQYLEYRYVLEKIFSENKEAIIQSEDCLTGDDSTTITLDMALERIKENQVVAKNFSKILGQPPAGESSELTTQAESEYLPDSVAKH